MSKPYTPTPRTAGGSKVGSGSKIANGPGTSKTPAAVNGSVTASDSRMLSGGPGLQPKINTAVPGPKSRALFADEQSHIAPGRQRISMLAGLAFDHGEGATLTDVDGNVFVDFFAGVFSAGVVTITVTVL